MCKSWVTQTLRGTVALTLPFLLLTSLPLKPLKIQIHSIISRDGAMKILIHMQLITLIYFCMCQKLPTCNVTRCWNEFPLPNLKFSGKFYEAQMQKINPSLQEKMFCYFNF